MLTADDIVFQCGFPQGGWTLSAIVDGVRVHRTYFFYDKPEATQLFLREVNAPGFKP